MCCVLELPILWQCYFSHNAINLNEPVYMVNPSKLANTALLSLCAAGNSWYRLRQCYWFAPWEAPSVSQSAHR